MEDNITQDALTVVNGVEVHPQQIPERRSERLKNDANLTTMEKIDRVAQKQTWKVIHPIPILFLFSRLRKLLILLLIWV
jgi:hypothetical protein